MLLIKKIEKIIEYGLYLLVFLLPIQTRWIIRADESEYLTVSLYGTDVLLITLLFLFAVNFFSKQRITNQKLRIKNYESKITNFKTLILNSKFLILIFIAGLDLTVFISIFFAQDKLVAIYRYGLFLLGVGLFWLIVSANYSKIKLVYSLLAGIFLQACLAIWQFLTQSDFACKWLGMALHRAGDLGVSVVETAGFADSAGERWLRAYGGLDHPNVLGGVLVVGLLLAVGLLVKNSKYQIPNNKQISSRNILRDQISNKYLLLPPRRDPAAAVIIFYFLLLTSLFFTFSRGAWLGLIGGILIMLAAMAVKKDLRGQKKLLQIILASSFLIFILFSQFQDLAMARLATDTRLEIKSNVERIESYKDSWQMIKNNWLFGTGAGNYVKYNANLSRSGGANYVNKNAFIQPAHNVFLLVCAEIGIVGLLFFIGLLLCVINQQSANRQSAESSGWGFCRGKGDSAAAGNMPLLAAMITMFLFDHWWWSLHFGVLFFWLVLGLIISRSEFVKQDK